MQSSDNSIVSDLFCGQILNKTICNGCQEMRISFEHFWTLSLALHDEKNNYYYCLKSMLDDMGNTEQAAELVSCESCQAQKRIFSKSLIWRLPEILIIHFKWAQETESGCKKITHQFCYPIKNLDLSRWIKGSSKTN